LHDRDPVVLDAATDVPVRRGRTDGDRVASNAFRQKHDDDPYRASSTQPKRDTTRCFGAVHCTRALRSRNVFDVRERRTRTCTKYTSLTPRKKNRYAYTQYNNRPSDVVLCVSRVRGRSHVAREDDAVVASPAVPRRRRRRPDEIFLNRRPRASHNVRANGLLRTILSRRNVHRRRRRRASAVHVYVHTGSAGKKIRCRTIKTPVN